MAVTFSGLTVVTQNGGGSWQDIAGGQGSSSTTISFVSGTSSQGRKFSGQKGVEWNFGAAQNFSNQVVAIRFNLVGGFAATRAAGGGQIIVNGSGLYNVAGSDTYTAGFQMVFADLSLTPSSGSFTNTAVTTIGFQANASGGSGGDPNFYVDELLLFNNTGVTATGDTTSLIADLIAFDVAGKYGIIDSADGIAISRAGLITAPNATGISSTDEIISFSDPAYYDGTNVSSALSQNGYSSTDSDPTTLTRATLLAADNSDVTGTSLSRSVDLSTATNDTINTSTFTGFDATTNPVQLGAASPTNTNFNACGVVSGSGTYTNCNFRSQAQSAAVNVANLNSLVGCVFSKDTTPAGHAVELTSLGTGSMTWDCTATGYDAGSAGSPVTPTSTGNEHIFVNVGSGTVTINVSATATTPSIRSAGATVNVVVGQTTVTVTPLTPNTEVRVFSRDGSGNNDVELAGVENSGTSFQFTLTAGTVVNVVVFNITKIPIDIYGYTVPSADANLQVNQQNDRNYLT